MINYKILVPLLVVLLSMLAYMQFTSSGREYSKEIDFINGVSYVAPSRGLTEVPFESVVNLHANWVAAMPFAFIDGNTPNVRYNHERQWWGERAEGIAKTIEHAKSNKLKVMLKPHVWVKGQGWTGDYKLASEQEWETWEKDYTDYILTYARIADSLQVEAFCVGLEFKNVVIERPEFFKGLISEVRKVYGGLVTYAANWDNYQNVSFWKSVDFIGINAYFPLSQEATPSVATLETAWDVEKGNLRKLSKKYRKPIVFTEFGYRSMDKAAGNQWELEHHRKYTGQSNMKAQENAYQALFKTFWEESWIRGGFLWKWYPNHDDKLNADNSDYTPQKKPVENIIRKWYKIHEHPAHIDY